MPSICIQIEARQASFRKPPNREMYFNGTSMPSCHKAAFHLSKDSEHQSRDNIRPQRPLTHSSPTSQIFSKNKHETGHTHPGPKGYCRNASTARGAQHRKGIEAQTKPDQLRLQPEGRDSTGTFGMFDIHHCPRWASNGPWIRPS